MFDSSTDAAFLRSIMADPDDDSPRLIYADWLDEQGDSDRAEFIRLQIRVSHLPLGHPDLRPMQDRINDLKHHRFMEWVNRLPQFEHVHWEIFDRGFISAVQFANPDVYFRHAAKVFRAAPIEEVRLHRFYWPEACRLGESPFLDGIRTLDMNDGNRIGNQGVEGLMKSSYLKALYNLKLGQNSLGAAAVRAIAMAPYMRSLRRLKLERNDFYDDALRFLSSSSNLVHLRDLDLDRTQTSDGGLEALASSKYLKQLRVLNLSNNQITAEGIERLVQSPIVEHLTTLFLQNNTVGDRGAIAIANSPYLGSLESLYLRQNRLGDEGANAFAISTSLPGLRNLFIGGNRVSDRAADELRDARGRRVNIY